MKKVLFGLVLAAVALPLLAQQKPVYLDASKPIEERVEDALSRLTLEEKVKLTHAQSKFSSAGVPRLGIPDVWTDDGPHGIRPDVLWDEWEQAGCTNDSCVAFPALTCLAATWNPEMSLLYGQSIGEEELRNYGVNDALIKEFLDALNNCEFARFAPGDDNQAMDKVYSASLEVISKMENSIKH